jgi:hypothetical protein
MSRPDPGPAFPAHERRRVVAVRGRLVRVSLSASMSAGGWIGGSIGLIIGVTMGALAVWGAGAILDWQREIAFTIGVTRQLLPLGAQIPYLRMLSDQWTVAVPLAGAAGAVVGAVFGGLTGGILAAAYNRSPRHATVVVELPADGSTPGGQERQD